MSPFMAAGLIKFSDAKEIEKIRLNPYVVILVGIGLSIVIILLKLLFPV
jgi:preprotein translocase subunit Sec61beta